MVYHILNGDALKEQLPTLSGEVLVFRECLVEGPVKADNEQDFFKQRAAFLSENYDAAHREYLEKASSQLRAIGSIPKDAEVNLWFEDDLFCQVNFWFAMHQLRENTNCFLVRPPKHNQYGFGGFDSAGLRDLLSARVKLEDTGKISTLWEAYVADGWDTLRNLGQGLKGQYPFILDAIEAHIQRQPQGDWRGTPMETLAEIKEDLGTADFSQVFREFSRRLPIYGFGDSQVKRLLVQLS